MTDRELLKQALRALESATSFLSKSIRDRHPKLVAAIRAALATPAPAQPEGVSMPQYWSVQVTADGEALVSIGNDWLSGDRPLEQQDEQTIIGAAQHLLSFVGYGLPPSNFNPDDDEAAGAAAPVEGAKNE